MNFQGVVMNVADLNRSIDFYREVLGFTLLSQEVCAALRRNRGAAPESFTCLRIVRGSRPHCRWHAVERLSC
jgi:catechol 2,3-dioxygenase-like lactoylglutathione lyase family enzyme